MKKNYIQLLLFFSLIFLLIKCSSPSQIINVTSEPKGAEVSIDGKVQGTTPYKDTLYFKNRVKYPLTMELDGYIDTTFSVLYNSSKDPKRSYKNYSIALKRKDVVTIELVTFEPISTVEGVKLSKVTKRSLAYLETIERSPSVKSVQRITENKDESLQIGAPILSPIANELIYYMFSDDANGTTYSNVWKQKIGATGKTRVTNSAKHDYFPTYSPDGEYIYFSSNRISNNPVLWRTKATGGGGITRITNNQAEDFSPSVSPDGKILVYASNPENAVESQIWTINTNGSLPTQLREGYSPQISPDGKTILFIKTDKENEATRNDIAFFPKQIWTMTVDGSSPTQLTQNNNSNFEHAKWSPDGKWIVYTSDEGKDLSGMNNNDIWIMKSDGTERTQLTTNGSWDDLPSWSSDGQWIYFRSNRGGFWNIWRFKPVIN